MVIAGRYACCQSYSDIQRQGEYGVTPNFNGLEGSKVICWNYCTRVNIRKGREPGNKAMYTVHLCTCKLNLQA